MQDSAAKLPTPGASDEKKKMIRQTSVHSLKKLFDVGLAGPAAVVFGRGKVRSCRAAGATCGC